MSMYCTDVLVLARNAPAGMRWTMTITLLMCGEMRSGVCGHLGSGGNALSALALAMPTRSAPSALVRAFTIPAVINAPVTSGFGSLPPGPLHRDLEARRGTGAVLALSSCKALA